jgi:UPF0271 protein
MQLMGDAAYRFDRADGTDAAALLAMLKAWPGVVDAVITERHYCISFNPASPPTDMEQLEAQCREAVGVPREVAEHVILLNYDGLDLPELAEYAGLGIDEVIERHVAGSYVVKMVGFQPGFAYLGGLDPRIAMPRRDSPRPRVPAGAVAIGGNYTGIYPFASPGGWNLIGSTVDFSPLAGEGMRLHLGDRVRFSRA